MAFSTLVFAGALISSVVGQEVAAVNATDSVGDSVAQSADNRKVKTHTAPPKTLTLFKSQASSHETPKIGGRAFFNNARQAKEVAEKEEEQRKAVEAEMQRGSSSFLRLLEIAAFLAFVVCPLMLTPTGRNALIQSGIVSADGEITKMSIKASGGLAASAANFPLVAEGLAAVGFLHQEKKSDEELGMEMINEGDGESEDEAEIIVDLGSLSRPTSKVEKQPENLDPSAVAQSYVGCDDDLMDFGSAPLQQQDLLDTRYDQINIDYQNGDFATDDFFDEDDDF